MTHVLNPKTNRMIKIGGKPWRRLVREGMLPSTDVSTPHLGGTEPSNNVLFEADSPEQADVAKEEILTEQAKRTLKEKAAELTKEEHPRRRGKKIVKVVTAPKHEDLAKYTAQCASRTLHKHINDLTDQLEYAYANSSELDASQLSEFENGLKELILQEMISGDANQAPDVKTMRKKVKDETDYELESIQDDSADASDAEEYTDDEEYEEEEKSD
jgi:hypothetical protein